MATSIRILVCCFAASLFGSLAAAAAQVPSDGGGAAPHGMDSVAESGAGPGATLWRTGDKEGARAVWLRRADDESYSAPERARALYNLGVAAFDEGEALTSSAYFEAALRLDPRFEDAAANRRIARAEAGLEPAGGEGITASLIEACKSFSGAEARWLAFGGALLFALVALCDALRGGAFRGFAWTLLLLQPLAWAPLVVRLATSGTDDVMVVAENGTPVWAGPNASGTKLGTLAAGEITGRVDELPEWTKVLYHGEERWVRTDALLSVDR